MSGFEDSTSQLLDEITFLERNVPVYRQSSSPRIEGIYSFSSWCLALTNNCTHLRDVKIMARATAVRIMNIIASNCLSLTAQAELWQR